MGTHFSYAFFFFSFLSVLSVLYPNFRDALGDKVVAALRSSNILPISVICLVSEKRNVLKRGDDKAESWNTEQLFCEVPDLRGSFDRYFIPRHTDTWRSSIDWLIAGRGGDGIRFLCKSVKNSLNRFVFVLWNMCVLHGRDSILQWKAEEPINLLVPQSMTSPRLSRQIANVTQCKRKRDGFDRPVFEEDNRWTQSRSTLPSNFDLREYSRSLRLECEKLKDQTMINPPWHYPFCLIAATHPLVCDDYVLPHARFDEMA